MITRIVLQMKRMGLYSLIAVLLLASGLWAETQGTFRGEVVRAPRGERSAKPALPDGAGWQRAPRSCGARRIVYDAAVPTGDRHQPARRALVPGTEVRVTALVDADSGEWTASRVEVIAHHAAKFEDDYGGDGGSGPDEVTSPSVTAVAARTI